MVESRNPEVELNEHYPVTTGASTNTLGAVLMLVLTMTGIQLSLMPVVADEMQTKFSYSDSQIGLLTSVLMFALAAIAIPAGLAAAKWGGRVLVLGCVIHAIGSLAFAFSDSYGWFMAMRLIQGVGAGFGVPASGAVIASCVSVRYRGRAWGIFGCGQGVGVMVALLVMPSVSRAGGYRGVFLLTAALAVLVALALLMQAPVRMRPPNTTDFMGVRALGRALAGAVTNRRILLLCVFNIASLAVGVGVLVWTPQFLRESFGASLGVSAYLTAGTGLAQLVANPIGAFAMERRGKLPVIFICLLLLIPFTALVPFLPALWSVFIFVTLAGFLSMAFFPPMFATVPEVVKRPEEVGAGTGLVEVFGFTGALLAPWLFGLLLDNVRGKGGYMAGYLMLAAFALVATISVVYFRLSKSRQPGKPR